MSEVRGSGLEFQVALAQEWPRGATLCLRSGAAAERSYRRLRTVVAGRRHPASEVRAVARRSYPASKASGAGRRHPTSEVRGGQEKPPRAQGQGQ